jgi:hypothetical protein
MCQFRSYLFYPAIEALWKEQAHKLIDELPAEATLEDLLRELSEWQAIQRALLAA